MLFLLLFLVLFGLAFMPSNKFPTVWVVVEVNRTIGDHFSRIKCTSAALGIDTRGQVSILTYKQTYKNMTVRSTGIDTRIRVSILQTQGIDTRGRVSICTVANWLLEFSTKLGYRYSITSIGTLETGYRYWGLGIDTHCSKLATGIFRQAWVQILKSEYWYSRGRVLILESRYRYSLYQIRLWNSI